MKQKLKPLLEIKLECGEMLVKQEKALLSEECICVGIHCFSHCIIADLCFSERSVT